MKTANTHTIQTHTIILYQQSLAWLPPKTLNCLHKSFKGRYNSIEQYTAYLPTDLRLLYKILPLTKNAKNS